MKLQDQRPRKIPEEILENQGDELMLLLLTIKNGNENPLVKRYLKSTTKHSMEKRRIFFP